MRQALRVILQTLRIKSYLRCDYCGAWYDPRTEYKIHGQWPTGKPWRVK